MWFAGVTQVRWPRGEAEVLPRKRGGWRGHMEKAALYTPELFATDSTGYLLGHPRVAGEGTLELIPCRRASPTMGAGELACKVSPPPPRPAP